MRKSVMAMNKNPMGTIVFATISLLLPLALTVNALAQATPGNESQVRESTEVRELYVPFSDLEALLGQGTNRVFMSRREYEELQESARQTPPVNLPHQFAVLSADYEASVRDGRAIMRGELMIDVLGDGLHAVRLDFHGVGIRVATLDGSPARLAKGGAGETFLFVEDTGKHELVVELIMPVATDAAQQTLEFGVPTAPSSRIAFSVPGNVEVKSGASIVDRQLDEERQLTRFQIVPTSGVMSITMSLNNRKTREQNTVMARGVVVAEVTQAYERLHASMSMNVVNGATDELRFVVDDELEVDSVSCELLSRWEVERKGGKKQLVVKLRTPTTERVVVNVRMDRGRPEFIDWRFPRFEPLAVAGYTAVVGLVIEDRLRVSQFNPESLFTIDSEVLTGSTADSMFAFEPGAPRVQAVAAFYAPSADYGLSAQLKLPERGLTVNANSLFTVSDRGIQVAGGLSLTPENEKLFCFDLLVPPGWNLLWVREGGDSPLRFDRYEQSSGTRIRVPLPDSFEIDTPRTVWFEAEYTPPNWLEEWETQTIDLPAFPVADARIHEGVLAVRTQDDLLVAPASTENLVVVSEGEKAKHQLENVPTALAYQYDALNWNAAVRLTRIEPRQTARVLSFVRIDTESLVVHAELIYLIAEARSRTLHFSLPDSTPRELSVSALDGVRVKETSSSEADGRRLWTVELAERHSGSVRLSVDFTQPLQSQEPKDAELPVVRAESVQYQTGALAIEGHPELETTVKQSPRTIDIGELVDAEYQVGKRLVGVYGYVGDNDRVVIDLSRRPIHALPSTVVGRAEVVTQVSNEGRCQTAARFQLRTKATLLESRLPQDAVLWSVVLDGKPALPQRVGDRVLISIPPAANTPLRDLQLVYETSTNALRFQGDVEIVAPQLFERDIRDVQGEPIPIADMKWQFSLPHGYRATRADGRVIATGRDNSSLTTFWNALYRLGGGNQHGLFQSINAARSTTDTRVEWDLAEQSPMVPGSGRGQRQRSATASPSFANGLEFEMGMEMEMASEGMDASLDDLFGAPQEALAQTETAILPEATPEAETAAPQFDSPASGKQTTLQAETKGGKAQVWALEGVRSLAIDLANAGDGPTFVLSGLGSQSVTRLTMINQRRYDWLAMAIGLIVLLVGLTKKTWPSRLPYLFFVILAAVLVPMLTGWIMELQSTQAAILSAVMALVVYYVLCTLWKSLATRFLEFPQRDAAASDKSRTVTTLFVLAISMSLLAGPSHAQQADPFGENTNAVSSVDQLQELLRSLPRDENKPRKPVAIPKDAVVVPYDVDQFDGVPEDAEKLLVPYETYQRLWGLAHPAEKLQVSKPPAPYAWSNVAYTATLNQSGTFEMVGKLDLEQFVDGDLVIPLHLAGCVLEKATLDGKPAKLNLVQPVAVLQEMNQAAVPVAESGLLMLHASGKGSKKIELRLRMRLGKSGGWRIASGRVPSAPASALTISIDQANTEIRFAGMTDRANFLTTKPKETLETAFAADGVFSIQWRDKISEASIDQGLTARSKAVFDIREDAMRLAWQADLEFRRGLRESFTLIAPEDYLIEKVLGDNVRGWTARPDRRGQQLEIEMLKPAVERESLTVILSKQNAIRETKPISLSVPNVIVPDAMLQQGQFTVRRSSLLELRSGEPSGLTRIDVPDESGWFATLDEAGPLPMSTYQAYRFAQSEFELPIDAAVLPAKKSVEVQSLVKLSQRETKYETRLFITAIDRPVYRLRIRLPENLELETPQVSGAFQWAVLDDEGDRRLLEIDMADGQSGQFAVVLHGKLGSVIGAAKPSAPASLPLPKIEVLDAEQQSGAMVVQVDPAYDVRATNLQACDVALLSTVNVWLSGKQRELARTVIRYANSNYDGALVITPRTAVVRSMTVTNIKVTDRAVEETIYLEATINSAGISEFVFLLPSSLSAARIQAPLLRRTTITPIDDSEGAPLRVTLELQDSIMGRFAVIVEHDRLLRSGPQSVPIPVIETGETTMRIVTLENASRDELFTEDVISLESLDRAELAKQARLDQLGGKSSMVFRVQERQADQPRLTYQTKSRETIETSGARIGLAETLLIVDELGAFRGKQEYRVENRTEPFLEVEMPEGSRLWTVQVAGENVKPSTAAAGLIRVPLIKTAEGDLDYPLILKYGGELNRPGGFGKIDFPLIKTVNINVELSQVRLRLPEDLRWFGFAGTMGRVQDERDLQAGWLSFRTKQISELTQLLSSSRGRYSKARAKFNLKQLESTVEQQSSTYAGVADANGNAQLRQQLASNAAALEQAQQQIVEFQNQNDPVAAKSDNRFLLSDLYGAQSNGRSLNVASSLGLNFTDVAPQTKDPQGQPQESKVDARSNRFDAGWLSQSKLAVEKADSKVSNRMGNRVATLDDAKPAKREAVKGKLVAPPVAQQPFGDQQQAGRDKFTQQQIAGDYQAQAERYSRRLQQNQIAGGSDRAMSSLDVTGPIRENGPVSSATRGLQTLDDADMDGLTDESILADAENDGGMRGGSMGGGGMGGGMGGGSGGETSMPQREGYLASLEVKLPVRGRQYMFTTPGGDLKLSARSVTADFQRRMTSSFVVVLIAIACCLLYRMLATESGQRSHPTFVVAVFAILGTVSLVSGSFPVYGAIAILIAITLTVSNRSEGAAARSGAVR